MASIERRVRDGSVRWRVAWRDPDGRQRSKSFPRQREAQRWATEIEHRMLSGTYVDVAAGRVLLRDYVESWRSRQVWRPSTAVQVEAHFRNHLYPALGGRPIASIRPSEIQAWVRLLAARLAPATVEVIYRYFVSAMKAAVADRIIPAVPTSGVKLPKNPRPLVEPLTVDQVWELAEAVIAPWRPAVILGAGCGLRIGEVLGLEVAKVDFLRRRLTVDQQALTLSGPPTIGPPKTEASRRVVPLSTVVADEVAKHLSRTGISEGLIFRNGQHPYRRNRPAHAIRSAVRRTGLPPATRFHDLRHFYASLLIRSGVSVKGVQARLGHASASETLDTYSHLWPDDEDRARDAVDALLTAPVAQVLPAPSSRPL